MKLRKMALRAGLALLVVGLVMAAIGLVRTRMADAEIRASHPAPGSFVDVGGHRLHYRVEGSGAFTFVLEAGIGDYSTVWRKVEKPLAAIGRVFVYDRAGYAWSEPGPEPRTMQQIVRELRLALKNAHVPGPYLLVGHSFGGITQTLFAETYPDDVMGLLLIDPSEKDQVRKLPQPPYLARLISTQLPRTASFGLAQLFFRSSDPMERQAKHIETFGAELRAIEPSLAEWGAAAVDLHHIPVYVLTRGDRSAGPYGSPAENERLWEIWHSLHQELVDASSSTIRKEVVVEGASHYIHLQKPQAVVDAARELVSRMEQERESGSRGG